MYGDRYMMEEKEYLAKVNESLTSKYSISIADTGYSNGEWLSKFGHLDFDEAVESYAEKYGLINLSSW
jgi:hypothetical protein